MNFSFELGGVTFYEPQFDKFKNSPHGQVGSELAKRGRRVLVASKRQVGRDTSKLAHSIHMIHGRIGIYQQLWIGSENNIALIHHDGTRPHTIMARGPGKMRYTAGGRMVYTRMVDHPGTKPNRYLSDNLDLVYV